MKLFSFNRWTVLSFCLVLLVAAVTRIGDGASLTHFRYDQARISFLALETARGDAFHWTGVDNSAGLPTSPLTIWFYALLFFIFNNPQMVTFMVALFNVVGVMCFWWIGQRYFGAWVGFFLGLFLAANPWLVEYSRAVWEPRVLLPFLALAFAIGFYGFFEKKAWAQALFLPLLLIAVQFHYAAFFLMPIYFFFLWAARHTLNWRAIGLSFLLGFLAILPFAYGLSLNGSGSGDTLGRVIEIVKGGLRFRSEPFEQVMQLITGLGSESLVRNQAANFLANVAPRNDYLWQSAIVLLIVGFVCIWRGAWRKYAGILFFWAFFVPLVHVPAWTGSGVYIHYHLSAIPAYAFFIAIALASIVDLLKRLPFAQIFQAVFVLAMVGLYISQALWIRQVYLYRDEVFVYSEGSLQTSTPLHYLMDVREALASYEDVIILGANPHESNYYVWETMLYDTASCVRDLLMNDGNIDILPAGPYAILVAPLKPINANYQVPARYQNATPTIIPLREGEDPYIIYHFDTAPEWTETPIVSLEADAFANGLQLSGYYLTEEWLQLRWQVLQTNNESYQFFAHFLDENGERIGQRDAPFYVGQHWCEGDTLITTNAINLPLGVSTLRIGMYRLNATGGTDGIVIVDETGNVIGNWIDIPLNGD